MEKYFLEKGILPPPVQAYREIYAQAQKDGFSKPSMPPAVREFYKISNARQKFRSIASCKDRQNKQYDMEAYTEEIAFHIQQTHPQRDTKAIISWKYNPEFYTQEQFSQQAFTVGELSTYRLFRLLRLGKDVNLYISNCDFLSSYSRQSQYVKAASAFQVDVDYYDKPHLVNLSPEAVYKKICDEVFAPLRILPNYGIFSGRGLYLVFLTETMDLKDNPHQQQLYKGLMEKLISLTRSYGADPSCADLSRVLRLPSTVNQKSGSVARILDFDTVSKTPMNRYFVSQLAAVLGVDTTPKSKPAPKPKPQALRPPASPYVPRSAVVGTLKTLGEARTNDLLKWLQNRAYAIKGFRNSFFLFLSCATLAYKDEDSAWEYIQSINRKLAEPQPIGELAATYKSAAANHQKRQDKEKGYFSFSNEYIIDRLQICEYEMQGFKTIISEQEKNRRDFEHRKKLRRNEHGNTSRQQAKADKIIRIESLLSEGKSQAQIAQALGVSRQLVSRYVKLSTQTVAL